MNYEEIIRMLVDNLEIRQRISRAGYGDGAYIVTELVIRGDVISESMIDIGDLWTKE